jgi:hypothetical protein
MADTSVEAFARRMATLPGAVVDATPDAVRAAAVVLEEEAESNLSTATGGDLRLSRVRSGRGAKVGVEVRVKGSGSRAQGIVVPSGPVLLVEDDTRAHVEPFQYSGRYTMAGQTTRRGTAGKRSKAARKGFLFIPGVGIRARVRHPGTKGKKPIQRAFTEHADQAGRVGLDVFADAIRTHLGS